MQNTHDLLVCTLSIGIPSLQVLATLICAVATTFLGLVVLHNILSDLQTQSPPHFTGIVVSYRTLLKGCPLHYQQSDFTKPVEQYLTISNKESQKKKNTTKLECNDAQQSAINFTGLVKLLYGVRIACRFAYSAIDLFTDKAAILN